MKLGDNMTMEAYNVWGDVPPRKCRPPKIGDIPKHNAVDEESPGSIPKSLTVPQDSRDCSPLDSSGSIVFPLDAGSTVEHFSSAERFDPSKQFPLETSFHYSSECSLNFGIKVQDSRFTRQETSLNRQETVARRSVGGSKSRDRVSKRSCDVDDKVTIRLTSEESSTLRTKDREDSSRIPSSPEELPNQEIVEVRKDSALFLEEAEGLPTLREILKSRGPRIIRPRRESSGYASNLGTFDEDRRSSYSTDVLQDLSSFLKERRRSSIGPKRLNSRLIVSKADESLTEEVDSVVDRMPTTEVHRKLSNAGLEMPNIDEMKELLRDEVSSKQEGLDSLCNLVEQVSVEELSVHRHPEETPDRGVSPKFDTEVLDVPKASATSGYQDPFTDISVIPLSRAIDRPSTRSTSRSALNRIVCQRVPSSSSSSSRNTSDQPDRIGDRSSLTINIDEIRPMVDEIRVVEDPADRLSLGDNRNSETGQPEDDQSEVLPRTIKVYQLLSTQSEDRTDREVYLADRRISLQISKQNDVPESIIMSGGSNDDLSTQAGNTLTLTTSVSNDTGTRLFAEITDDTLTNKVSTPNDIGTNQKFLGDNYSGASVRPIYPYCPYSPYGSPQGSPRNRRRPLRESRRVSIDNRQGALQLNQYKLLDNIGQGSYGIVKLVYNEEDETHYAMKILSKRKLMKKAGIFGRMAPGRKGPADPLAKVYREIALLKKLDHPNVVKLVEVLDDPDEDNLYLVFELVQRGEILQIPAEKPLDEETARLNFRDVVMGVEYLHYQRIVHRDIKPSNLLVDSDGRIKIADLGVSAELRASGELLSGPAGTPAFAAPETTTPGAHYSGTLCDVWSMGVTLYSLVTGRVPWDGAGSIIGVQAAVRTEPLKFPDEPSLTDDLRGLISQMLAKNPADRIPLAGIKVHDWLTKRSAEPLPTETDNCRLQVTVTDEEVERVVTRIPKLDTLILIKTMLKQHSFQNPFLPKKSGKTVSTEVTTDSLELPSSPRTEETSVSGKPARNLKTERFQRTGRSNSAPDSYDWQTNGGQISIDSPLPPVTEASSQETETERR
ncbi:PREDICTED: serine/threonine-protein kinase KIPK [Dufourea novaeangliae]|uniref:serine/threonine-protein kinase KIPK n=1 Tax=Dufourea novaeangliae TaxID=178035 RepID=UPI00076777B8|nr:PREDICTED: serine/threonine-protein kinase KIPK [Dufourea novaeangliae]